MSRICDKCWPMDCGCPWWNHLGSIAATQKHIKNVNGRISNSTEPECCLRTTQWSPDRREASDGGPRLSGGATRFSKTGFCFGDSVWPGG